MEIGQKVAVLDDAISGVIIKILGNNVTVLTSDDFELDFSKDELIVIDGSISKKDLLRMEISAVLFEKEQSKPVKVKKIKAKGKPQPAMEVDLHINQLIPNTKHLLPHDILTIQLDAAKRQLEFAISKRIQRVIFIHGVGEGVLRMELEYLFGRYDNLKFYDADYQKYGRGATEVYIFQNVNSSIR